jgi:hypothetical protein
MRSTVAVFLILLGLSIAATGAHAGGITWGLDGPHYGRTHRAWRDDCGKWERRTGDCGQGHSTHAPRMHRNAHDMCDEYRALFTIRHGLRAPGELKRKHGCDRWRADYDYHAHIAPVLKALSADIGLVFRARLSVP